MSGYILVSPRTSPTHRAVFWEKNGDHPDDRVGEDVPDPMTGGTYKRIEGAFVRFYRNPSTPGDLVHMPCGRTWHDHGWIDRFNTDVCPGSYIVQSLHTGAVQVLDPKTYEKRFLEESK